MKRNILVIMLLLLSTLTFAQIKIGVKTGMAFGYNGNLKQTLTNIKESNAKDNIGWHAGLFGRINVIGLFVQPEIYFSSMKTEFDSSSEGTFTSRSNRLDIPVLVGKSFFGITRVYAGPVFSTSLNEHISLNNIRKTKTDDFSLAGQVGGGLDISSFTFDVRYEFGFNKNQTEFVNKNTNQEFQIEKRPNSLLVSVGYKF